MHVLPKASGIAALHAAGIVHRDLRPKNVLIDTKGHPIITGFACATTLDISDSLWLKKPLATNTKAYQAPELLLGWAHDFSVDCWAFGILLYMMLYGTVSPSSAGYQNGIIYSS